MRIYWPHCEGLNELAFAETERCFLQTICGDNASLHHATDVIQLHILLGLAITAGSAFGETPPARDTCRSLFNRTHEKTDAKQPIPLTKGGVAYTKHAHRSSDGWWGVSTGTNAAKNAAAENIFARIWDNATWHNIFWLPHQTIAFEIRVSEGYGMRFQRDAKGSQDAGWTFRGFVEPAVSGKDGHATKWRH